MTAPRLRIAFVYDAVYPYVKGGAERRNFEIARRLAYRHDVHLVSWTWWGDQPDSALEGMTLHGVGRPPALYGGDGKRTVREALAFSARVLPVLIRNRVQVIDAAATPYLPLGPIWLASRLTRSRLVVTWHEFWGEHWLEYLPRSRARARIAMAIESAARRFGDELVAVSTFTARALSRPQRTRVVPNGVTLSEIDAACVPEQPSDVVYLGRLIDEKRVDLLIEAAAQLHAALPELRYSIIGSGPERERLEALARRLQMRDRITFHGELDSAEAFGRLKAARLLVLPSVREGFGMAVAEAQAAGTVPLVVRAPANGAVDLVRDGVDGLVVASSAHALAGAMGQLLGDSRRVAEMSATARQAGRARDWNRIAEEMEAVYVASRREPAPVASLEGA